MRMKNCIVSFLFICIPLLTLSQKLEDFQFQNFTVRSGLPSNEVFHCIQDYEGYIWFATSNGIARFNGNNFETFSVSDGLPNNQVFRFYLQEDSSIIGECGSNQYFEIRDNSFTPLSINPALDSIISKFDFSHAYIKLPNGEQMFGTRNGSYIFSANNQLIESNITQDDFDPTEIIYQVFDNYVFVYTVYGAHRSEWFSIREGSSDKGVYLLSKPKTQYSHSKYGTILDSTSVAINLGNDVQILNKGEILQTIEVQHPVVGVFYYNSILWLCTIQNGILGYKFIDGEYTLHDHYLKELSITSILQGRKGNYWITSTNNGVYKINPKQSLIRYESNFKDRPSSLFIDHDYQIIGFDNGEIKINGKTLQLEEKRQITGISDLDGELIIFSDVSYQIDGFGNLIPLQHPEILEFSDRILRLNDSILIFKNQSRITKFNEKTEKKTSFESIGKGKISAVEILDGNIIFSLQNQLITIDPLNGQIINQTKTNGIITDLIEVKTGIAALTEKGFFYLIKNNKIHEYSLPKTEGVFKYICGVFHNKTLVVSTNLGINFWNMENFPAIKLSYFEPQLEANLMTVHDDSLFFVSDKGLCAKSMNESHTILPDVAFESLTVNDQELENSLRYNLTYGQDELKFRFSGISTEIPIINYKYKLSGVDKHFRISKEDRIMYSSVQPGEYTFIYSATVDGYNYSRQKEIMVSIGLPYWKKTWFITLVIVFILAFILGVVYWRNRRLKSKLILQNTITELKAQALSAQLNPHLIFNVLNSIQSLVSLGETERSNIYISRFSKFMRGSLKLSKKSKVLFEDEIEITEKYIDLEKLRFGTDISFEFNIQADSGKIVVPPLILQPFIENAIKHGVMPSVNLDKRICITSGIQKDKMWISIEDNGVGFQGDLKDVNGDGLRISTERLLTINPKNKIELVKKTSGTLFIISIYNND